MPRYRVNSPDGRTFDVDGPDGSTKEDAIEYIRSREERQTQPQGPSLSDTLASIDSLQRQQSATQEQSYDPQGSSTNYIAQQAKKGFAAGFGAPVDLPAALLNLGIAGYGVGKNLLTGSSDLPELIRDPVGGSGTFNRLFQTNDQIKPTSKTDEVAGRYVRDLSTASVPAAGLTRMMPRAPLSPPVSPVPSLMTQGGLSLAASTGGELARTVAPEPYKDTADMAGMLVGGIAVPGMIANRVDAVKSLKSATDTNKLNAMADRLVRGQITDDVRHYPGAAQNIDDAMRVEGQVPGLQYRIGQASGVPSLLDMERRVATAGPQQFNQRAQQDIQQQAAIRALAEGKLPLLSGKNDVDALLAAARNQRQSLASALPETAADDVGRVLRDTRTSMKGRYDQIAADKFGAPVREAERLDVRINPSTLMDKAHEVLSNPILQFDGANAPAIARRIADFQQTEQGPRLLSAAGKPIREKVTSAIGFADLKAMREAVNQDIAREAGSPSSNARQRLRGLVEIRGEIDRTAQQAPESVRKLYNDATNWYRDVYAPKFLRGVNLKQSMKDITGEMRIPEEKLAAQYFKPLGSTPMKRFMDLYGDNPQAMRAMESHVLDTYRKNVVRDGVIDPQKHEAFMRNYDGPLKLLPETGENFKSLSAASRVLAERETQLANAQKVLSQGQLDALKYEALPDAGLDPRKINAYLAKNSANFKESISEVYGAKVADEHLKHLREIAKAAEIADRGRLTESATPKQNISPMSLQGSLGFTGRTLFSMFRAVTTGRTSPHDVAYTLGAQSATHRIGKALIAAEERAISDPDTAKLIAQAMKQSATSEQGKMTLKNILAKGGLYLIGGNKYAEFGRYRAAPTATDATQYGINDER